MNKLKRVWLSLLCRHGHCVCQIDGQCCVCRDLDHVMMCHYCIGKIMGYEK